MRTLVHRPALVALAATAVVAMTTGVSAPATAGSAKSPAPKATEQSPPHRVQLLTGDVAEVTDGRVSGFQPAPGRENIPVHVTSDGERSLVVPLDAQRLIADGKLDERLFDVAALDTPAARTVYRNGLRVIVGYRGAAPAARAEVRDTGSVTVRRTLGALNAEALTAPSGSLPALWKSLTRAGDAAARSAAPGIDHIWLDAPVHSQLDVSVPQIGADKVWAAGYDGKGVKVAVVDTGVDETHPDLAGKQIAEKNFSTSADAKDRQGHGTHVASTIAGSGAKSGGTYKGVAPGASIIDAKVLDDSGSGAESDIITGIEWAVGQGADIVNMSLGGPDAPGVEPLEETVNHYSESDGVLFAIAAGNEGPGAGTVGTPGAADSALTVGAVDSDDKMASFSSRGPRVGDGAIKPDVTAPGVDITAASAPGSAIANEYGENPEGYVTISGTSMATPHVAGSAALLKQRHPDWTADQLKGVLTGSAKDTGFTAFEQGSGRIQADRAIGSCVYAEETSLNFGTAAWPHEDDEPVRRTVTYRNAGTADVTLDLTAGGTGPDGTAAPAGMFTVSPAKITVPAGQTAEATVTADTATEAPDGQYTGAVVAAGADLSVRTAFAVDREVASYPVELTHLGRDGKPAAHFQTYVKGLTGEAAGVEFPVDENSDSATLRLPVGEYTVQGVILADRADSTRGTDWIAQPRLVVDQGRKVTLDARTAKPVDLTVADRGTEAQQAYMSYSVKKGYTDYMSGWRLTSYENFRSAHLGPGVTDGSLQQLWDADFAKGEATQYSLLYGGPVERLATGFARHPRRGDLAELKVGIGEPTPGKDAFLTPIGSLPGSQLGFASGRTLPAPSSQRLFLSTADGAKWSTGFEQLGDTLPNGWQLTDSRYGISNAVYRPGHTYRTDFDTGVFGPVLDGTHGLVRSDNTLYAFLSMFSDGQGHDGTTTVASSHSTLYRDGEKVADNSDDLAFSSFTVPAEDGSYTLSTSLTRDAKIARAGTRIDASWTFRSKDGDKSLPVSVVRFHPDLDLRSQAPAGRRIAVPVEIQGAAAGGNVRSLTVEASYDDGATWRKLSVRHGAASLRAPARGKGVALRAEVVDRQGNKSAYAVHNAFLGR
ncbi:S8 family serine peptidase [Streptomyces sp. ITFR-16]|uniref:S8 family peptidase n=1 Tax=Streptomyces sp. ITFR-16 TaxID=3075198 RepID=UPI00288C4D4D|nr:S8 family serine peptidase [Streptomyces sp. ITFR-16]WNI21139.1 S8 family serine peptidase [Streptomyces sp. ITFR-16]